MSAAATAAGYLYASGRLRGRAAKEQEQEAQPKAQNERAQKKIRVAVYPKEESPAQKPRRAPKIEYRRKRWPPQ